MKNNMQNEIRHFINNVDEVESTLRAIREVARYLNGKGSTCSGKVQISVGFDNGRHLYVKKEIAISVFTNLEQHYSNRLEELAKAIDLKKKPSPEKWWQKIISKNGR